MEYRLVDKYGFRFVEIRYKGHEWSGWYFLTSEKPRKYWKFMPEFGLYRSNVSWG